jgi:cytochrome oxidase Cu insertion factor (SCO1/SenC/PrrC family)
MIPFALVAAGGYLAVAYAPAPALAEAPAPAEAPATPAQPAAGTGAPAGSEPAVGPAAAQTPPAPVPAGSIPADVPQPGPRPQPGPPGPQSGAAPDRGWRGRVRPRRLAALFGNTSPRTLGAIGALGVAAIGVIPLATASASASASPILAQAIDGSSAPLHFRAPAFTLTNQQGRTVSLASLHGKVVLLTFLDPVCTSDCPLIAQEFRQADQLLGSRSRQVELVAVVTNPVYTLPEYTAAFDRQEHMNTLANWQYLTGSADQLKKVWRQYGIAAQILPAGGMIGHSDIAYVIDRSGRTRTELNFDPGPGTSSTQASFASELSSAAQQTLGSS